MSLDPEFYKKTSKENFIVNNDIEDIINDKSRQISEHEIVPLKDLISYLIENEVKTHQILMKIISKFQKKYKLTIRKNKVLTLLVTMITNGELDLTPKTEKLRCMLIKKASKSESGVLVITVVTSPYPNGQKFSCEWNCYYCPNEPKQPRSYLHDEPSVIRANRNNFDPILQFYDRAKTLLFNGHPVDKIELLVLGGTWASYPHSYQEEFIRDLFYAANTFYSTQREKLSLSQEKKINETTKCRIIGITLETRPDCITPEELERFRYYGCTRVQLGIQHTDDKILKKINRGCTNQDTVNALKLLKENCFKVDIHLMPNLPGSNPVKDTFMFNKVLNDPYLQADQWKIYPCETVPWTIIQKWYQKGEYKPYEEDLLMKVLIYTKSKVHPWIRLNRVVRDIPSQYIVGGIDNPSMRQDIHKEMKKQNKVCKCIRCREIKNEQPDKIELVTRTYPAQDGIEYFISFETPKRDKIVGFVRLRINSEKNTPIFPELISSSLVRELHVYGKLNTGVKSITSYFSQHKKIGTRLMKKAEEISRKHKCNKISVISGVGVRGYYRKLGYSLSKDGEFMTKDLNFDYGGYHKLSIFIALIFLCWIVF